MHEQKIRAYLEEFGLEKDIISLYLTLYQYGPMTISELSRMSHIERTRVYRLLDHLKESCLLEVELSPHHTLYGAAPVGNLQVLITKKEQHLKHLQTQLASIEQIMPVEAITSPATSARIYRGDEGMKQLYWNQARAQSEVLVILYKNIQLQAGDKFFERWVARRNEGGVKNRGLVGDEFIKDQTRWYTSRTTTHLRLWEPRYIAPSVFPVTHNQAIYDDVVVFQNWQAGEIFGVEIRNKEIAEAHRYFFEAFWRLASPVNDITGEFLNSPPGQSIATREKM